MSDTSWTPDKIALISTQLAVYAEAQAALASLAEAGAEAKVTLLVTGTAGVRTYSFDLNIVQATSFFTPVVDGIAAALTAQGVVLSVAAVDSAVLAQAASPSAEVAASA